MKKNTKKKQSIVIWPFILVLLILIIFIYLLLDNSNNSFTCSKNYTDTYNISYNDKLEVKIDGNHISNMVFVKTIKVPEEYLINDDKLLDSIKYSVVNNYKDNKSISVKINDNKVIIKSVDSSKKINLNNILISKDESDNFNVVIDNDRDNLSLKVGDSYLLGDLESHLRNNQYVCK